MFIILAHNVILKFSNFHLYFPKNVPIIHMHMFTVKGKLIMKYKSTIIILLQQKGLCGYILSCPLQTVLFIYRTACMYSDKMKYHYEFSRSFLQQYIVDLKNETAFYAWWRGIS